MKYYVLFTMEIRFWRKMLFNPNYEKLDIFHLDDIFCSD